MNLYDRLECMKQGILIANGVILEKHEMRTVVFFLGCGINIELIVKSNVQGVHTPDLRMLGLDWEMKAPRGEGKSLMKNTLQKAASQAENIIIDLRRTKRHQTKCLVELEREFKFNKHLKRMKVITKERKMLDFEKGCGRMEA